MQSYKRKITYFYQYHNKTVGATAGFLKLEIRGDQVKMMVNIQEPPGLPFAKASLLFYHEAGDHLVAVRVDTVESRNGMLSYSARTDWQRMFGTDRDLYTFDGVMVMYNENHYYIGDFKDKDRRDYAITVKEKKAASREVTREEPLRVIAQPKPEPEPEKSRQEPNEESKFGEVVRETGEGNGAEAVREPNGERKSARQEMANDFEKMLVEYPKLPMYGAAELFDCVRIHPRDIGRLDMRNWKLGVNSFLTHGYYTYQYLMLGKMRLGDGVSHAVLGVPGIYSGREKYLANMFGFEQFIPVKKTGVKTGEFGYWIVEISPYL